MVDRVSRPGHPLLAAQAGRGVVAAGAMGTMLQARDLSLDDFAGLDGCTEMLTVTRPDVVRAVHRDYLDAGADAIETNTFGANLARLAEYGIVDRIRGLAAAGARLARESADEFDQSNRRRLMLGSVGPRTKLPPLGHAPFTANAHRDYLEVHGLAVRLPAGVVAEGDPANIEDHFALGYREASIPDN